MKLTTLCYIEKDDSYLMLHRNKKKNDANEGKWIGVGGHFESDESPEDCLLREVREETGLLLTSFTMRGLITFVNDKFESEIMCLYTADGYEGEITSCDEGELKWIPKVQIKELPLWEGDKAFLDILLSDERRFFSMKLRYEEYELVDVQTTFY